LTKQDTYDDLIERLEALLADETDTVAIMATIVCELYQACSYADWVGFYRNIGDGTLKIGPYNGPHGCITIPFAKGICGKCAREKAIQNVPDVPAVPQHIACSCETRSEIVLPVLDDKGHLLGVLDVDSNLPASFDDVDERNLARICDMVV
jgi:L-methionine (R)-S-oxide reductase